MTIHLLPEQSARLTLMGVYHLLCWGFRRGAFLGLGSYGSNSCSGILTTAFLGLSSLAPSSVDPFSPQRTFKKEEQRHNIFHFVKIEGLKFSLVTSMRLMPPTPLPP